MQLVGLTTQRFPLPGSTQHYVTVRRMDRGERDQHLEMMVEKVVLEEAPPGASLRYYREPDRSHHVPKRGLQEVLLRLYSPAAGGQ